MEAAASLPLLHNHLIWFARSRSFGVKIVFSRQVASGTSYVIVLYSYGKRSLDGVHAPRIHSAVAEFLHTQGISLAVVQELPLSTAPHPLPYQTLIIVLVCVLLVLVPCSVGMATVAKWLRAETLRMTEEHARLNALEPPAEWRRRPDPIVSENDRENRGGGGEDAHVVVQEEAQDV